jgi:hypothetical protein
MAMDGLYAGFAGAKNGDSLPRDSMEFREYLPGSEHSHPNRHP